MESRNSILCCFSLGIFLLLLTHANAKENKTEPRFNVNLSPFEKWRSAYFCLWNTTRDCSGKDTLQFSGWLNVLDSEISDYCNGGCQAQNLEVMKCIQDVHDSFIFQSGAPLAFVRNATLKACTELQGFNTTFKKDPNSATSLYGRLYLSLVSALTTMALIATFG